MPHCKIGWLPNERFIVVRKAQVKPGSALQTLCNGFHLSPQLVQALQLVLEGVRAGKPWQGYRYDNDELQTSRLETHRIYF